MKPTYPVSDHCDGERFFNPEKTIVRGFTDLIRWQLMGGRAKWPKWIKDPPPGPIPTTVEKNEVGATFINHATVLVQTGQRTFITDPVYSKRVSPVSFVGPQRVRAPGLAFAKLPKIDSVLLSHNHYDHLDLTTLHRLKERCDPEILAPLGVKAFLESHGFKRVIELDWWQVHTLSSELSVTFVPAQHWSTRGGSRNQTLWGGYVIAAPELNVFFAGDTGYASHFKELKKRFGVIDVSFLPIGAYEPRWFMKEQHMNPADAVQAHLDLESRLSIGIHFGTFQLTNEAVDEPPRALAASRAEHGVAPDSFVAPAQGESFRYRRRR